LYEKKKKVKKKKKKKKTQTRNTNKQEPYDNCQGQKLDVRCYDDGETKEFEKWKYGNIETRE
jgi:hypothetical protein